MRTLISASAFVLALAAGSAAQAQIQSLPQAGPQATPQVQEPLRNLPLPIPPGGFMTACRVDPAISRVTLFKTSTGSSIRLAVEVINRGTSTWTAGANQALVNWQLRNNNTGQVQGSSRALATSARAGARMLSYSTPYYRNAFDTFEFGGNVTVSIAYDPDIAIDGNRCNDDANIANNTVTISNEQVAAFLGGRSSSQTFTF